MPVEVTKQSATVGSTVASKTTTEPSVMHSFKETTSSSSPMKVVLLLIIILLLGVGSGFMLSKLKGTSGTSIIPGIKSGNATVGKTYGSADTSTFKDTAEGTAKEGGIAGEGQYHLVRPGGDSQNVYMTSSTLDLSQFIGRKIKVWGQTQQAQKAGWLMDVGKVQVLE